MPSHPKTTLWLWPTGLFPRRIIYYFRAKGITTSILNDHNIHLDIIQRTATGLVATHGYEERPAGTSVPVMRIEAEDETWWIRESNAVLEYFEEVFGPGEAYPNLLGETARQRARTRDVLSCFSDASVWSGVYLFHSEPSTAFFSGLRKEDMSPASADHGNRKFHGLLAKLDGWVKEDIDAGATSLAGKGGSVTLADFALMSHTVYFNEAYGTNAQEEHKALKMWFEKTKGAEWYVETGVIGEVEKTGEWEKVLG